METGLTPAIKTICFDVYKKSAEKNQRCLLTIKTKILLQSHVLYIETCCLNVQKIKGEALKLLMKYEDVKSI